MKYTQPADLTTHATPGTVTALVAASKKCLKAIVFADIGNSSPLSIGANANANLHVIPAGDWYVIEGPSQRTLTFDLLDLADWNIKSAGASQTYRIAYS
jgi:hypothetical protein